MNAQTILEMIKEDLASEYTIQAALYFLEDGNALAESGITGDDQETIEELHAQLTEELKASQAI
jgi:bacterioferritin (cytochrome b1)